MCFWSHGDKVYVHLGHHAKPAYAEILPNKERDEYKI